MEWEGVFYVAVVLDTAGSLASQHTELAAAETWLAEHMRLADGAICAVVGQVWEFDGAGFVQLAERVMTTEPIELAAESSVFHLAGCEHVYA